MGRAVRLVLRRLSLGVSLIVAASAVLLLSDRERDEADGKESMPQAAMLKCASRPLIDTLADGMTDGLAERGYVADATMKLTVYDAQSDIPTAAAIATEITGGGYDLVLTVSTPSLQAVARAKLPLFSFAAGDLRSGSVIALSRDYYDAGHEAGLVAARALRGESPAGIPLSVVKTARLGINLQQARRLGIDIPATLLQRANNLIR